MRIDPLGPGDWPAVRAIYEAGIATGNATFETTVPDWPAWDAAHLAGHRLVARDGGRVVGWVALAPVSDRCAYAGVAEDSIYIAPDAQGRGVGRALLAAVVASAERGGAARSSPDRPLALECAVTGPGARTGYGRTPRARPRTRRGRRR